MPPRRCHRDHGLRGWTAEIDPEDLCFKAQAMTAWLTPDSCNPKLIVRCTGQAMNGMRIRLDCVSPGWMAVHMVAWLPACGPTELATACRAASLACLSACHSSSRPAARPSAHRPADPLAYRAGARTVGEGRPGKRQETGASFSTRSTTPPPLRAPPAPHSAPRSSPAAESVGDPRGALLAPPLVPGGLPAFGAAE